MFSFFFLLRLLDKSNFIFLIFAEFFIVFISLFKEISRGFNCDFFDVLAFPHSEYSSLKSSENSDWKVREVRLFKSFLVKLLELSFLKDFNF